ncbi:MAG: ABC-F family ATP-binding cassette domain-containing protein [Myxococcales bacterium FL481]|nr:MAG: ABC-F family ATP-binding cassette domain-containing protein [Myxococcales bacterium FL481]
MMRLDGVSKQHGQQIVFLDASLSARAGDRMGLVGPNGSGKSTLFRLICGQEAPDSGEIIVEKGVRVGYFDQNVGEMAGCTVLEQAMSGAGEVSSVRQELAQLELAMADPERVDELDRIIARFGEVQSRFDELDGYALEARAREVLEGLGFRPDVIDDDVGQLSGGWKMRVAIAGILLMRPDLLLLDEPTNHLDIESIIWLEAFLARFEGALIITSHDREFLDRVVTSIVEIDGGELSTFSGNFAFYERQRAVLDAQAEASFARQQAMLAKEKAFIARFKARASHAAQVQSRVKKLDKIELLSPPRRTKRVDFEFAAPKRSGDDVVRMRGLCKAYGERKLYDDFEFAIRRLERWCVMGINGAGKSTLLKMVVGETEPDAGEVKVGASASVGYFAQHTMELLDGEQTILESFEAAIPLANRGTLLNLGGAFGFSGADMDKKCKVLSGGERARAVLAKILYRAPNFLVLDEPTNHLDMETKAMLVDALASYEGTMLFVSHDRSFLTKLSNRVIELGSERPRVFDCGYAEYVSSTGREAPGVHA